MQCGSSEAYCINASITIACTTQYKYLVWQFSSGDQLIFTALSNIGDTGMYESFTATLVKQDSSNTTSLLTFTGKESISDAGVECIDGGDDIAASCVIALAGI